MTVIETLELRVAQIKNQMEALLQIASTDAQKQAVTLGHQMTIDEIQTRINALKAGESDPWG
jgi:polysaccharide deacetylase 2 family uncharacterized protein YibQ